VRPGYLYPFSTMQCFPAGRQIPWVLDEGYRLSYRTMNQLLDERVAEVLDGLSLLRRKAELAQEAANLMGSNAFDAVGWVSSMAPFAHISTHALSTPPVPRSGALCHGRPPLAGQGGETLSWVRLDGCAAEDFSKVLGFSTGLTVQLVTK
jgi:hypothetical protein